MDFETPREAALMAEMSRLKAENAYLRQALDVNHMTVTPIGVVDKVKTSRVGDTITLPVAARVGGSLSRYGNYHVEARVYLEQPEDLMVTYFAPADIIKSKAHYAINELLPYLHKQFILALGEALNRRRAA